MKNVVIDEVKNVPTNVSKIENILYERIEENKGIFSTNEITIIKSNSILINKIYILGILDAKSNVK